MPEVEILSLLFIQIKCEESSDGLLINVAKWRENNSNRFEYKILSCR